VQGQALYLEYLEDRPYQELAVMAQRNPLTFIAAGLVMPHMGGYIRKKQKIR
jgi:hypothetical protein